jgi:SagB-type dehydrogenase family enzyme
MEDRRSLREYGERLVTASQLGEFLYRVARVRDLRQVEVETPHGPVTFEMAARPFPSGGSLYELEFYLAVQACDDLDPGQYCYDSQFHRLARVCGQTPDVEHLIRDASSSAAIPEASVQVVVVLAARFRRLTWKYSSIAYALILKHVGVVFQTMYLTATAMGLAPCALGGGDSDVFARASGVDYYDESSVGEFLLGSRPASRASRADQ